MNRIRKESCGRKSVTGTDAIEWKDYPRIVPGEYRAYCKWGKHYRDPGFSRWTCLLRWDALTTDLVCVLACVPQWFALGARAKPQASRRGKYLPEWIRANGGPPARKDRLSPNVFLRRLARVEIRDSKGPAPYSVVHRIIEWETGAPGHSISKSHSQGRLTSSSADREACGERLADFEASALAGVEGEITPANTQGAGVPVSGSPVKGSSSGNAEDSISADPIYPTSNQALEKGCD
jgi:hypothetical protein